jgi:hypothetical protein
MLIRVARAPYEAGERPAGDLDTAMGKLIGEWTEQGILVGADGLRPPSEGTLIRLENGKVTTKDGPYTEAKEVVGGFFLLNTKSQQHAKELTQQFVKLHAELLPKDFLLECEVRAVEG